MSLRKMVQAAGVVVSLWAGFAAAQAREVVDIAGRTVSVPDHVKRVILGEGRLIYALEPLEGRHLFDRVVGWQGEFRLADTQNYKELVKIFPQAAQVAVIGRSSADTINPEKVLDLHPDLAIFTTTGHGPGQSSEVTERLRAAHIPVIFVDFRQDPIAHTVQSMRVLGQALDREAEARAYTDFYENRLDRIHQVVAAIPHAKRPSVFIDMLAGARTSCCHTAGRGNMGALIEAAGGRNVAANLLPGYLGDVSAETLLTFDPDLLILDGTRGPDSVGPGLKIGAGVSSELAKASLTELVRSPELRELRAVRQGRVYGIWHAFYDNPFNILAVEAMAKWFYPDRFADLDPEADRAALQTRFTTRPLDGAYWVKADAP